VLAALGHVRGAGPAGHRALGRRASEAGASERWELCRAARGPTRERADAGGGGELELGRRGGPSGGKGREGRGAAGPAEMGQGGELG
jgi:hypothetical protein